jgi:hypothetical protein
LSLDAKALDLDGLRRQLQPYATGKSTTVVFYIPLIFQEMLTESHEGATFGSKEAGSRDYVTEVLQCALEGFGRRVGFQDAIATIRIKQGARTSDWSSYLTKVKKSLLEEGLLDEAGVGNDKFTVYPVRSTLSRLLFSGLPGPVDCVLVLHDPMIPAEHEKAIEESVAKLNLKRKEWLIVASAKNAWPLLGKPQFYRERLGFANIASEYLPDYPSQRLNTHK